jgi:methyl-CpG-binding domain protein 4
MMETSSTAGGASPYFSQGSLRTKRRRVSDGPAGKAVTQGRISISPYFAEAVVPTGRAPPPIPWYDDRTCRTGDPGRTRLPVGWHPPRSPYSLIEEWLWNQPWRMLIACILLNKTTGKQLLNNQVLQRVMDQWPSPGEMARADVDQLESLIQPLGLHRNRSRSLVRFSAEYLANDWDYPIALHGIGKYADDAYRIFCLGEWQSCKPADKQLKKYVCWIREQHQDEQAQQQQQQQQQQQRRRRRKQGEERSDAQSAGGASRTR